MSHCVHTHTHTHTHRTTDRTTNLLVSSNVYYVQLGGGNKYVFAAFAVYNAWLH